MTDISSLPVDKKNTNANEDYMSKSKNVTNAVTPIPTDTLPTTIETPITTVTPITTDTPINPLSTTTTTTYDDPTLTAITDKLNQTSLSDEIIDKKANLKMETLLINALNSLNELFTNEKQIPYHLFNDTKGIIFLSVIKGGLGICASIGSGFIITKLGNNSWSGPCAIGLTGISIGFDIGVEKIDHILLLRDELALQLFETKGTWNIGGDLSIATGPFGGNLNIGLSINDEKNVKSIYSYSIAKGAYVGVSLEGSLISVRDENNEKYYGRKMNVKEILHNYIIIPQNDHYSSLVRKLNDYCLKSQNQVL